MTSTQVKRFRSVIRADLVLFLFFFNLRTIRLKYIRSLKKNMTNIRNPYGKINAFGQCLCDHGI